MATIDTNKYYSNDFNAGRPQGLTAESFAAAKKAPTIPSLTSPQTALTPTSSTTASTTTLSNTNKIGQIPSIVATTDNLATRGITADQYGNKVYANGTIVQEEQPSTKTTAPTSNITNTGGFIGEMYYAPGSTLPTGADGKPLSTTTEPTSPISDEIMKNLKDQMAQSDKNTASIIEGITAQYAQLRKQQEEANRGQLAGVQNSLLMGGVTGQGSSAQYAPISSSGIISSQINYGLQNIAELNNKEAMAISMAREAQATNNFRLMDQINQELSRTRAQKIKAATELNETIAKQNAKLKEENLQVAKDKAISDLYSSGTTDPASITKELNKKGVSITAKEVAETLKAITPDLNARKFENDKQEAARKFAVENGITKPFYLIGNTAIDVATGEPVSLLQYQMATGQAGKSESETDFSHIQSIASPFVKQLMEKYPDAGIRITDTSEVASSKLKNSSIYRKSVQPTKTGGGVGGGLSGSSGKLNDFDIISEAVSNKLGSVAAKKSFQSQFARAGSDDQRIAILANNAALPNEIKVGVIQNAQVIKSIEGVINLLNQGVKTGLLQSGRSYVANKLGTGADKEVEEIRSKLITAVQPYRNKVTGAAWGAQEEAEYEALIGSTKFTPEDLRNKLSTFKNTLKEQSQTALLTAIDPLGSINQNSVASNELLGGDPETYVVDGVTYKKGADGLYYETTSPLSSLKVK